MDLVAAWQLVRRKKRKYVGEHVRDRRWVGAAHPENIALSIAGDEILCRDIVVPVEFHLVCDVDIAPILFRNDLLVAQPMLRGDKIARKAMCRRNGHAINHATIERARCARRKLPLLVGGAHGCRGNDLLAQRLGDGVSPAVRCQLFEDILPMKPDGVDRDTEDHADFLVRLAFGAPG